MFDAKKLLVPISGAQLFGEDLSFSREIDAIVDARRFDDPSLDQGEWVTEIKTANWPFVIEQCTDLIAYKSKDLRLAVWLTEASAKVDHFAGLAEGYQLLAGLCDEYWDGLYPLSEGGDQEQRIGNLYWILTRTIPLINEMPITEGRESAYSLLDFDAARARAANAERLAMEGGRPEEGPKLADMEAARRKSSKAFHEKLFSDAKNCLAALNALEKSVDARLGAEGPGFSAAKEALEGSLQLIARYAQVSGAQTNLVQVNSLDGAEKNETNLSVPGQINSAATLQNRAQALAQLRCVADFFRRTEPHSPVAYLADKAAHWGEMSLHTWLSTVIKDPNSLAHVEELLGLKLPPQTEA
ncbi:MAG: type VI secretion system protein TssA [Pseudomonadota bacterium]